VEILMPVRKNKTRLRRREAAVDLTCHGPAAVNPSHFSAGRTFLSDALFAGHTECKDAPGNDTSSPEKSHQNNETLGGKSVKIGRPLTERAITCASTSTDRFHNLRT